MARRLAQQCRKGGKTLPVVDLVIVSCALVHRVSLDHQDSHFATILEVHAEN
jgi:predicted nucleic acid-binding protein